TARASFLRRSIAADFLQPHFPGAHQRLRLIASEDQEDEETYTDDRARFTPRLELQPLPALTAYAFYRIEYDSLSGVKRAVARRYAGGIGSRRGYERRHVGPLIDDAPIGGRSLLEGSAELRHPVTERLGAAVFADAGQVSLASFDFPLDDLRYGFGFGLRYKSPVGPLRVDLGFPLEPPRGDARWQLHLSVGQAF